jgi:hypothetical protein
MNQKLPEIQNAVFRVARLVFSDGAPRTRKAIDYFLCAACDAPWTFDWDATAFLKDETTYDNKTIVDALINVGFRMFLEQMNLAEIRAAVQKELDNGKRKSRPGCAS